MCDQNRDIQKGVYTRIKGFEFICALGHRKLLKPDAYWRQFDPIRLENVMTLGDGAYICGLFDNHVWVGDATLDQMVSSDFNLYVFWAVHVDGSGDLHYNNEPLIIDGQPQAAAKHIAEFVQAGQHQGKMQDAYVSVGGWGVADFANVADILRDGGATMTRFERNIDQLCAMGVTGVDLDYEEALSDPVHTLTELTHLLSRHEMAVSYCPYTDQAMWIDCLKTTFATLQSQPVTGLNLQCYAGGGSNTPGQWVDALTAAGPETGVKNPAQFVRPGLAVQGSASFPHMTPMEMQAYLSRQSGHGAWIWNTEESLNTGRYSLAQYAAAIAKGARGSLG